MRTINYRRLLALLSAVLLLAFFGFSKISLSYDLQFFLPEARDSSQATLLHNLQHGGSSRLLFIGLRSKDGSELSPMLLEQAQQLLQSSGLFASVRGASNELSLPLEDLETLQSRRYLLADQDWSEEALRQNFIERKADLQYVSGQRFNSLFSRDPGLALESLLQAMNPTNFSLVDSMDGDIEWRTSSGYRLLLAESNEPAFDVAAQQLAYRQTYERLTQMDALEQLEIKIAGVGAISAQVSDVIQQEAVWRSLLASALLLIVLIVYFRDVHIVLLAALPLLCAAVAGFLVLALVFESVHGITLAFGFTLLGVAIDYPIHLFSHARERHLAAAAKGIWPTLLLGLVSTVCVYLAMAVAGSTGLVQLGVFTAVGLLFAGLATRYVLPWLSTEIRNTPPNNDVNSGSAAAALNANPLEVKTLETNRDARRVAALPRLSFLPALAMLIFAALLFAFQVFYSNADKQPAVWSNDLGALSPVDSKLLAQDQEFRSAIGAANTQYAILLQSQEQQRVLEQTEQLDAALHSQAESSIGGWTTATRILPSDQTQLARRAAVPSAAVLNPRVSSAQQSLGFSDSAFDEFLSEAAQTRSMEPVSAEDILATPLGDYLRSHLHQDESKNEWRSVVTLYDAKAGNAFSAADDVRTLRSWLTEHMPTAQLLNYKESAEQLVKQYRNTVLNMLAIMLVLVLGLLLFTLPWRRALWCMASVIVAMCATMVALMTINAALDLYHLIALLLVLGLGLDYSLFRSRPVVDAAEYSASRDAVSACAVSTVVVFTTLAFSDIPALRSLGQGVALGALACFLLTRLGAALEK